MKLYQNLRADLKHLCISNCSTAPFTLIPVLLHIIANPTIPLHILVANALDNISSFHYKQFTRPKRVIDWTNYWQYDSFSQSSFIQLYPKNVPKKVFSTLFFYQFNVELSKTTVQYPFNIIKFASQNINMPRYLGLYTHFHHLSLRVYNYALPKATTFNVYNFFGLSVMI